MHERPVIDSLVSHPFCNVLSRHDRIKNMNEPTTASLAQNVAWAVSNLCRGKPVPELDIVKVFIYPLVNILNIANENPDDSDPNDIRTDTTWALSYLCDGDENRIQAVETSGALPTLMKMVKENPTNRTFMIPTVRCLGNFVTGTDTQTDAVLRAGFLDHASDLLDHQSVRLDGVVLLPSVTLQS
jgi:importin subunit alpha-1